MGIELTGCPDCDESLIKCKDLCPKHKLEMCSAQITYWTNRTLEILEELKKEKQEHEKL